ncbi:DUF3352 domain-containing protein [Candidatus Uabimicrobium amorphum]|uniref:CARDB domain-containing protein n=1 Tax=Uabimicrobium amorphum TaxID=2596890 RepID=A0A5S9INU1_UABAM|nr:DUF3352 domain-containing protein [Candidatus Uabimicrobium amorphum]BBM83965.1 hypothetical protein UABAM_02320 [Candidatus Uabimicrobium amorphum]
MKQLILLCSLLILTHAQDAIFSKIFPKDTFAVMSCSNIKGLSKDITTTNIFNLATHPELRSLRGNREFNKFLGDVSRDFEFASSLNLAQVWKIFAGEISVALTDVPLGSRPPQIATLIHIADHKICQKLLDNITSKIPEWKQTIVISGTKVQVLKGLEHAYYYVMVDDYLFIATGKSLMQKMLNNWRNAAQSLQKNREFATYYSKVKSNHSLFVYVNIALLVNSMIDLNPQGGFKNILHSLGIRDWRNCGIDFSIEKSKILTQFFANIRRKIDTKRILDPSKIIKKRFSFRDLLKEKKKLEEKLKNPLLNLSNLRGVNALFPSGNLDTSICKYIPQDTWGMVAMRLGISKIWSEIQRSTRKIDPHMHDQLQMYVQSIDNALGFKLQDFFDGLGDNHALFHLPQPLQKLPPRLIGVIEIRNKKKILDCIERLLRSYGYKLASKKYEERLIFYMEKQDSPYFHDGINKIFRTVFGNFAFFIDGKYLVCSRFPQNLMDVIDHVQNKRPSFDFASICKLPCSFVYHVDWKQVIPPVYSTLLSVPHFWEKSLRVQTSELPRASTFLKYCDSDVISMHNQHGVIHGKIHSNFGMETYLFAAGFLFLIDEMWSSGLNKLADESMYYLRNNKKTHELLNRKRYYEALQLWKRSFRFEYFSRIAKKQRDEINALYNKAQSQLYTKLRNHFHNPYLQSWQSAGDWQFVDGVLQTHNENAYAPTSLYTGQSDMSDYVLSFEVKGISERMDVGFHCGSNTSVFSSNIGHTVSIPEIKAFNNRWVPWKFKVHKNRITYWQGIKHHVVSTSRSFGKIRFSLPQDGKVQIRNIKLHVAEKPLKKEVKKPVVVVECYDTVDPLAKGQIGMYGITLTNKGSGAAENLTITTNMSSHVRLAKDALSNIAAFTLQKGESVTYKFPVIAVKAGSGVFEAFVHYKGQPTKILLKEYTYVR